MANYSANDLLLLNVLWQVPHIFFSLNPESILSYGVPSITFADHAIRDQMEGDFSSTMPIPAGTFKYAGMLGPKLKVDTGSKLEFGNGKEQSHNLGMPTYSPTKQTYEGSILFTGDLILESIFRFPAYYDSTNKIYEYGGNVEPTPTNMLLVYCNVHTPRYFKLEWCDKIVCDPIVFEGIDQPAEYNVTIYSLPGNKPDDPPCLRDIGRQNQKEWYVDRSGNRLTKEEVMAGFRALAQIEIEQL